MVFATGDCHGNYQRFKARYFPEQHTMDRNDYIIICGDFGYWSDTPEEEYWLDWLEEKPFTTLWVDGNHENFDRLNALPVHEWHGGKVHYIRPHVIHLMRGQLYDIEGYTITHCAPTSIAQIINRDYQPDALTDFLEIVNQRLDFHYWLFGHYHDNQNITDKHVLLWEQIVQVT